MGIVGNETEKMVASMEDHADLSSEQPAPPPEAPPETAPPAPAESPRDLRAEISHAVESQKERARSPDGKFAKEPAPVAKEPAQVAPETPPKPVPAAPAASPAPAAPEPTKPASRPPNGFSIASKAIWDKLPEEIRADIAKREQEVDNGFKRYSGLGKFAEEAERNGTTLQAAVTDYAQIETALRKDFVGGIEAVCRRMGVDPRALITVMTRRYDQPPPPQAQAGQPAQAPPSIDPEAIAQHALSVVKAEIEQREVTSLIASFEADPKNRFFGNVRQDMAKLVQAGKATSLQEAYDAACWLNPEIRTMLIEEQIGGRNKTAVAAANQARSAAKAVSGSPAPGFNPDKPKKPGDLSLVDEIKSAIAAQRGTA